MNLVKSDFGCVARGLSDVVIWFGGMNRTDNECALIYLFRLKPGGMIVWAVEWNGNICDERERDQLMRNLGTDPRSEKSSVRFEKLTLNIKLNLFFGFFFAQ